MFQRREGGLGRRQRPSRPPVKDTGPGGITALGPPHDDTKGWWTQIDATFGTSSRGFAAQELLKLGLVVGTGVNGHPSSGEFNHALAAMGAIAPTNELEAMLGSQIVGAHVTSMRMMARAGHAATPEQAEAYAGMASRLSRMMALQVETLAKLRTGGKQQVEVRYVYVNGNAIIGDVLPGGGSNAIGLQPHATDLAIAGAASLAALRGQDQEGLALPSAGSPRTQPVQDARRRERVRRAAGTGERPLRDGALHHRDEGGAPDDDGSPAVCRGDQAIFQAR